jgi:excisionase family DNA binding protein
MSKEEMEKFSQKVANKVISAFSQKRTSDGRLRTALSTSEACAMLGVSSETLRVWVKNGDIISYKIGRKRMYSLKSINSILEGGHE